MAGETDVHKMLASLAPELVEGEYVFCTFPNAQYGDYSELGPIASMQESEGLTLLVPKSAADDGSHTYESVFKKITLKMHSSLDAVGLTAAFATKLTEHGISANVIAGFYHDHILVGNDMAERAMHALREFELN